MLSALKDIVVLDLTRMVAGPFATLILADCGAEVIKIERPGGDEMRAMGPYFLAGESLYFMAVNRGKKSLCLDLTKPEGKELFFQLASKADVVIENFRYGVSEKLGCDYKTLQTINPKLIVCAISAFGQTGPDRELPAFDLTLQARGGTMSLTGDPHGNPVRMGPPVGDLAGGLYAAIGVCSALYERSRTGKGTIIDVGLLDCQVALLTYASSFFLNAGAVLGPQGSAHAYAFPYQTFQTKDIPIAVAVFTDRFWKPFCVALEKPQWADDPSLQTHAQRRSKGQTLVHDIDAVLKTQPAEYWLTALYREGVPSAPVQSVDRVFSDQQVIAREMIAHTSHPVAGNIRTSGNPIKMGEHWHNETHTHSPLLGEHTVSVLQEYCACSKETIEQLQAKNVIQCTSA